MLNKIFFSERLVIKNKKDTFEGWYFRHDGAYKFSLIVGVSHSATDPHSFIQYIDKHTSHYFRFAKSCLLFLDDNMTIKIEGNTFSLSGIDLDLKDGDFSLRVKVGYSDHKLFKKSPLAPSVMGVFAYLPLKCNHVLVSAKHSVNGTIELNGERFYADGFGYIEKDFGSGFPKNYAWMHACGKNVSIMLAVAYPLIFNMKGYLCVVQANDKQYNFSKYTRAKLESFSLSNDAVSAVIKCKNSSFSFSSTLGGHSQRLIAPNKSGNMCVEVFESISSAFDGELILNNTKIDTSDIKTCALEIALN